VGGGIAYILDCPTYPTNELSFQNGVLVNQIASGENGTNAEATSYTITAGGTELFGTGSGTFGSTGSVALTSTGSGTFTSTGDVALTSTRGNDINVVSDRIAAQSKTALDALSTLPDNWNGTGGSAPTSIAIEVGKKMIDRLAPHFSVAPFFYPAPKGGIITETRTNEDRLTIIIEDDLLLGVAFIDGNHEIKEFVIRQIVAEDAIDWLASRLDAINHPEVRA
jgi:hypothetical protein